MATGSISSLGVGSGIDLNSLLNQLVALERTPIQQIQQREASSEASAQQASEQQPGQQSDLFG